MDVDDGPPTSGAACGPGRSWSVFDQPEFRHARWHLPIRTRLDSYRIDVGFEAEKLAVELDGRAYHAATDQWERDIRRDLELATLGWQTVRLPHATLHREASESGERLADQFAEQFVGVIAVAMRTEPGADVSAIALQELHAVRVRDHVHDLR
jgi:very-short-patch-repair endonuclease